MEDLEVEFNKLSPWITKFEIDGIEYGGKYHAANDIRLQWFQEYFSNVEDILESGSLEGGHSFQLARLPNVRRVVAIEGRKSNVNRTNSCKKF